MNRKVILAVADGVGDRPCEILGGKTPLEYASTPNLDKLASVGATGIMDVHGAGIPVGTDLGHMILFGYGLEDYPGRGPIEAFGREIELQAGDVAFRSNFATVNENLCVVDRRAGRIRENTNLLAQSLNNIEIDGIKVIFKEATEHRAVLILRGPGLSANITDTDPKVAGVDVNYKKCQSKDGKPDSIFTAEIVNKFLLKANEILSKHPVNEERISKGLLPANFILTRGAGIMPKLEKISEKLNIKGACVAAEGTVLGVARLAGFTALTAPTMTGNIDTDVNAKAQMAVDALKDHDFVLVNLKATDLFGHDGNPEKKAQAVEVFDKFIGLLLEANLENTIIAVTADHSTPCERMEHSGDPVPVLIAGPGIRQDRVTKFDEISCSYGGLCRIKGKDLSNTLYDFLEKTKKQGN
ncbi:MAG: 2,3-bisphosphoglycerate-independent phosphoglycerate mutase [Finegoldia magna]|uniref:2,3-bisphosphoglycerate-independent phosphoglycerate mutase n=1 Tax=Finegoldia magna TaxID=1260 RepID=UPI002911AE3A|nr:2,3-bisphosphoglycerate-independent phosphoglycerate mutase [Finegoldia magna]MDU5527150.1 2,3-bisphosphoglycerate-independent phosphoglycerate mutase [Finegoldia magna]